MKNGILCASDTLIIYYTTLDVNVCLTTLCQYAVSYLPVVLPVTGIQGADAGRINCKHAEAGGTTFTAEENLEVKGRWPEIQ